MARANRHAGDHLTAMPDQDVLDFFEFVRARLDEARRSGDGVATIGSDAPPGSEAVRFGTAVGQRHQDDDFEIAPGEGKSQVIVNFMGLTGPSGVLPEHYTERVVEHRRNRDPALGEFLDLFNHRALSHFWRAWAKYRLPVAFASDDGQLGDAFSRALKALSGLGVAGEPVADEAMLSMSGSLARRVRSAGALRRILRAIYGLPAEIIELQGRWVRLAADDQSRLGSGSGDDGAFCRIGEDLVAGAAIWDVGSQFRVRVGPLDLDAFRTFFRSDGPRAAMSDTIRRAVGGNVDFTVQLVLRSEDVPMLQLDQADAPAALGQSTWLLSGASANDRDDAVLSSSAAKGR